MALGGGAKCVRCQKTVYAAESVLGPGGEYHNSCLKCIVCNKRLDSTTLTDKDGQAWCKACYGKEFGPKGYGFAGGAAFMATEQDSAQAVKERIQAETSPVKGTTSPPRVSPRGESSPSGPSG
eukprot:TRINITY_DN9245_c0_g1::TRINITY_DN9245_c0_g1_i1::g.13290::m.13290 TRINITY_DN9245_c0_g1::TRINITY_DN9245_c0_g1_i1::g.13290  ORF type:complete len:123 (-),score=27.22,sp/Q5RCT4/CSRP1_PONAB/45.79/2e-23,sp/Q5RCT4/CSRP1_PONAB/54.55/7e-19,LIM/PF00412.17/8.2e-13,DUF4428/PF14471.1/0.0043 TRINITY_DN9245_c0_g1_i1:3-371(-)